MVEPASLRVGMALRLYVPLAVPYIIVIAWEPAEVRPETVGCCAEPLYVSVLDCASVPPIVALPTVIAQLPLDVAWLGAETWYQSVPLVVYVGTLVEYVPFCVEQNFQVTVWPPLAVAALFSVGVCAEPVYVSEPD